MNRNRRGRLIFFNFRNEFRCSRGFSCGVNFSYWHWCSRPSAICFTWFTRKTVCNIGWNNEIRESGRYSRFCRAFGSYRNTWRRVRLETMRSRGIGRSREHTGRWHRSKTRPDGCFRNRRNCDVRRGSAGPDSNAFGSDHANNQRHEQYFAEHFGYR